MQCKYGYTFDVMSTNKGMTIRDARALEKQGVHLVDQEGNCRTCEKPRLITMSEALSSAPIWQWFEDHLPSVQHVETVGVGALIWCANCGLWIDDDAWVDAETLLDQPISELMEAALSAEQPLSVVDKCSLCEG